jgi:hypothetical protein
MVLKASRDYILDADLEIPIPCYCPETLREWHANTKNRIVKRDVFLSDQKILVSTVFLSKDHNFSGEGLPILWETMIFDEGSKHRNKLGDYCERYTSKQDALEGHERAINLVKALFKKKGVSTECVYKES